MERKTIYRQPPYDCNDESRPRKVGFELECSGISVEDAAGIIQRTFSGSVDFVSEMVVRVDSARYGRFTIELDWDFGKKLAEKRLVSTRNEKNNGEHDLLVSTMKWLASQVVPVEIVCPPLELDVLPVLDTMVDRFRQAGAKGTEDSLLYAFGVHINPEVPSFDPAVLVRYLKAFGLCQEWLVKVQDIDLSRLITPYINLYARQYLKKLFSYDGTISMEQLIGDYLVFNPTRNRALDMIPLWLHINTDLVRRFISKEDDPLSRGRPTFHYRLPNCEIDRDYWYLSESWNRWCVIEHLAAHEQELQKLTNSWLEQERHRFIITGTPWHQQLDRIYQDLV